jgi:hypothetical protein
MNTDILLDRSFLEAVYSHWGFLFIEQSIIFIFVLIGWIWFFRQRDKLANGLIFKIFGITLIIDFISPTLAFIIAGISLFILLGGALILGIGLSSKLAIQNVLGTRETIQRNLRFLFVGVIFFYTFPVFFQMAKITSAAIQGPQIVSTFLSLKFENIDDDKIKLSFDGPVEKIVALDVLLPVEYNSSFKEGNCYQVTYFYSPIPPVIFAETYVTKIQAISQCEPQ